MMTGRVCWTNDVVVVGMSRFRKTEMLPAGATPVARDTSEVMSAVKMGGFVEKR
jgi:hypothetical protein